MLETSSPEPQVKTSLLAKFMNVFAVPGEVFDEVRQSPVSQANWLVPALTLVLVGFIGSYLALSQQAIQQQMREMQEKPFQKMVESGKISQEMANQQMEMAQGFGKIGAYVSVVTVAFVTPFFWGLMIWLVGTKVFGSDFALMKGVEVVGLAACIDVLNSILTALLIISMGSLFASPSAALLVKDFDPQNGTHGLLALLNPIVLWTLAVYAVGLGRIARVPFARAAAWVFGIWIGYKLLFIGFGLAMKAAFHL